MRVRRLASVITIAAFCLGAGLSSAREGDPPRVPVAAGDSLLSQPTSSPTTSSTAKTSSSKKTSAKKSSSKKSSSKKASSKKSSGKKGSTKKSSTAKSSKAKTSPQAKSSKAKSRPPFTLSGAVALQFIYDDNIIHYSDEDLFAFETLPNDGRFSIETAGDWIVRPRLEFILKSKALTGKTGQVDFRVQNWRYVNNGIKNNVSYYVRLKHPGFGRDNFQLSFYHAPLAYLRNFLDRPPFSSRAQSLAYTDFSYTSNTIELGYWRRLSRTTDGKLELGRSIRYYNQAFMENDNWEWRVGGYIGRKITNRIKVTGEYFYSHVRARAADSEGESREVSDDGDASYKRDSYRLSVDYRPKGGFLGVRSYTVRGQYQAYYFTSERPFWEDRFHVGRKDQVYRIEFSGESGRIWGPVSLEAGYRFTERTSTAAYAAGGEDIGEDKDYTDNRFWFGIEYPF